jgi:signal peptidase I
MAATVAHSTGQASSRARRGATVFAGCAVFALFLGFWFTLAPTTIGGRASYVVVEGTSMLPHFRADGLVLMRAQGNYHVGEVVAYHNRQLHEVVMHRIVARDGDHYVFQGDNNNFRDSYHPAKADLVGKEWMYWPGGGTYLQAVRSPVSFGLIVAVLGLIAGTAFVPSTNRKRRRHHAR